VLLLLLLLLLSAVSASLFALPELVVIVIVVVVVVDDADTDADVLSVLIATLSQGHSRISMFVPPCMYHKNIHCDFNFPSVNPIKLSFFFVFDFCC